MAYNIQKTDDTTLVTVNDTELNTDYGITLVGRNYSGYGVYLNDNFVRLMENFAKSSAPARPIPGQLWFDTVNKNINLYQGTGFKTLASLTSSLSEPAAGPRSVGDLWWDLDDLQLKAFTSSSIGHVSTMTISNTTEVRVDNTGDLQLGDFITSSGGNITLATGSRVEQIVSATNVRITNAATITTGETITFYRGTGWNVIGPAYSVKQGMTGIIGRTIVDTNTVSHTVGVGYVKDQPVMVISRDAEFTPRSEDALVGWTTIKPGVSMRSGNQTQSSKTVTSTVTGSVIPVSSTSELAVGDTLITSNIAATAGVTIQNIFFGNTSVLVSTSDTFYADEIVSFQRGTDINYLFTGTATNSQLLDNISSDRWARRDIAVSFADDITTLGNLYLNNLSVVNTGGNVEITNGNFDGNITILGNVEGTGPTEIAKISNTTGRLSVALDPETELDVVTKQYADAQLVQSSDWLAANVTALIGDTAPSTLNSFSEVSALANTIIQTANVLTADVALKSYIASPTFTGTPRAPTAAPTTNSTQIATTEYVMDAITTLRNYADANATIQSNSIDTKAPLNDPILEGTPRTTTNPADTDQSTRIATTRFVSNLIAVLRTFTVAELVLKAPLASPALSGVPTAPTATTGTDTTQIATTAFVNDSIDVLAASTTANAAAQTTQINLRAPINSPTFTGTPRVGTHPSDADNSTRIASTLFVQNNLAGLRNYTDNALGLKADKASPTFTGVPAAPTAVFGTSTTQLATTAFVQAGLDTKGSLSGGTFTGNVFVPTPASAVDNSTRVPNTAWVRTYMASYGTSKQWDGAKKYVSTLEPDPGSGDAGDFWFQYTP